MRSRQLGLYNPIYHYDTWV